MKNNQLTDQSTLKPGQELIVKSDDQTQNQESNKEGFLPETGIDNNPVLFGSTLVGSLVLALSTYFFRRNKKTN
ncbi:LPXTG cell wall anchor domain-containing protein [Staphylococcus sp. 17KM0847]|nr:LPXTG cell wall anchor domain-containing protein [Staphylococcus sp. 17KM0847]